MELWNNFVAAHQIARDSVPLFSIQNGTVETIEFGKNKRLVLRRSVEMEALMRGLTIGRLARLTG